MISVNRVSLDQVQIEATGQDPDDPRFEHNITFTLTVKDAQELANRILRAAGLSWAPEVAE